MTGQPSTIYAGLPSESLGDTCAHSSRGASSATLLHLHAAERSACPRVPSCGVFTIWELSYLALGDIDIPRIDFSLVRGRLNIASKGPRTVVISLPE